MTSRSVRPVPAALLALLLLSAPAAAAPEGTMTWGLHVTLVSR